MKLRPWVMGLRGMILLPRTYVDLCMCPRTHPWTTTQALHVCVRRFSRHRRFLAAVIGGYVRELVSGEYFGVCDTSTVHSGTGPFGLGLTIVLCSDAFLETMEASGAASAHSRRPVPAR